MANFDLCIPIILKLEGGYQRDPDDIGNYTRSGELKGTKYGISARIFPDEDICNLTIERAKELYYTHYWKPLNVEEINNQELALHIFDHAVNAGKKIAIRMIQEIVEVKADGIIGEITTKAINEWKDRVRVIEGYGMLKTIVDHYKYARHIYYTKLIFRRPASKKYYKGWLNRIEKCHE